MLAGLKRLFTIKTRWEAWAVIWAISLGGVERGKLYLQIYPGALGWVFFALCTAVVFLAGPRLLDSVRPVGAKARPQLAVRLRPRRLSRNQPRPFRPRAGSESGSWSRRS